MKFVEHRIADQRVVRLIQKWLNAGVMEEGRCVEQDEGVAARGSRFTAAGERLPALRV